MNYSYWELKEWFTNIDFTIVGSGIVGLSCALELHKKYPSAKIVVLEKGMLPQGASTKNAGFACFGSLSEIIDDLQHHSEKEVFDLVKKRWDGLTLLRKNLGDKNIDYQSNKGYELFQDKVFYEYCLSHKNHINRLLNPIFNKNVFKIDDNIFKFNTIYQKYITNQFEGQIDTGKMMTALLEKTQTKRIKIINNISLESYTEINQKVNIKTNRLDFYTNKLLFATNGFASQILNEDVQPARAQVVITKPINNLHIKGTFHLDKGYYYFRNINNRILFGGGRNLDFKTEETSEFGKTEIIQNKLKKVLESVILPNTNFEIDYGWSGIMGVGNKKKPIIKQVSDNVYCGIRLGGMGVAIGSNVGKELSEIVSK